MAPMVGAAPIEGNLKMRTFTMAAIAAATCLCSASAYAGCANLGAISQLPAHHISPPILPPPSGIRALHAGNAGKNIVGTWLVTYTIEGEAFAQAYIQWHDDGTEWENINLPPDGGNICMGSWKTLDNKHVYRSHAGWNYTDGQLSGYFTETETDLVGRDGTYSGTNELKFYDLSGNLLNDVTGTSSATIISP